MKVLHHEQLPVRLPLWPSITFFLLLDRCHSPGWVWGAGGLIVVLAWISFVVRTYQERDVKIQELS